MEGTCNTENNLSWYPRTPHFPTLLRYTWFQIGSTMADFYWPHRCNFSTSLFPRRRRRTVRCSSSGGGGDCGTPAVPPARRGLRSGCTLLPAGGFSDYFRGLVKKSEGSISMRKSGLLNAFGGECVACTLNCMPCLGAGARSSSLVKSFSSASAKRTRGSAPTSAELAPANGSGSDSRTVRSLRSPPSYRYRSGMELAAPKLFPVRKVPGLLLSDCQRDLEESE